MWVLITIGARAVQLPTWTECWRDQQITDWGHNQHRARGERETDGK